MRVRLIVATLVATGVVAAGGWGVLAVARPTLVWSFSPATNQLHLAVAPGGGPLGGWVASRTTIHAPGRRSGRRLVLRLHPGQHLAWRVALRGPASVTANLALAVPPAPSVRSTTLRPHHLVAHFDAALAAVSGSPGVKLCGTRSVCLPRGMQVRATHLSITAADREASSVSLTVPALTAAPLKWFASPAGGKVCITSPWICRSSS